METGHVLRVIRDALDDLESQGVNAVMWKSNEHLGAALKGETDLDILVEDSGREKLRHIMDQRGFVVMEPPRERRLPGLESFGGVDHETGALAHFDVHYQIVLGELLLKNHHLPVEEFLLRERRELLGAPVPAPERELVMLYIRSSLKTKTRQIVAGLVKGRSPIPESIRSEARWLAGDASPEQLVAAGTASGLPVESAELKEFHSRVVDDRLDWRYVLGRRRSLTSRLRRYERMPWYAAAPRRVWLRMRNGELLESLGLGLPRRHLDFSPPVVALVGADGAGKTRLAGDLRTWLGAKLIVHHLYFGQPKGGLVFKALNKPGSIARNRGDDERGLVRYTEALKWLWLAVHRRRLAAKARSLAGRGEIVIAERYPLREFHSMEVPMDGPRLQLSGPFARVEMAQYRAIPTPGLTIVLDTDLETLRARKIDLPLDEHIPKVEAVVGLEESPTVFRIDVGRPYEEVLLEAKRRIWGALIESH